MLNCFVGFCWGVPESVACTVKVAVPAVVGVPEITPVAAFNVKPAGSAPMVTVQLTAGVPPLDCSVVLYSEFTAPVGSVLLVMTNC